MQDKNVSDSRWQQRFANYQKAFAQLSKFLAKGELNELEEQGLIQSFEYTHELAWKTLKDFLENSGNIDLYGSKDTTREAFKLGLIEDGEGWMLMIQDRNQTSQTYNPDIARTIVDHIRQRFYFLFELLLQHLKTLQHEN